MPSQAASRSTNKRPSANHIKPRTMPRIQGHIPVRGSLPFLIKTSPTIPAATPIIEVIGKKGNNPSSAIKGTVPYRCRSVKTKEYKLPTMQDHQPIEPLALRHRIGIAYHPYPQYEYQYKCTGRLNYSHTPE